VSPFESYHGNSLIPFHLVLREAFCCRDSDLSGAAVHEQLDTGDVGAVVGSKTQLQ
jgi:hypothetical protein